MASSPPIASPLFLIMISSMLMLISCSEAREFMVGGGEDSWKVPLASPDSLNQWAKTQHFSIGDALIFKYDNKTESVHVVNERDYSMCNTVGKSHKVFKDGNSKVWLTSSGPIHFISGDQGHCHMGLKLAVAVMSSSSHHGASSHSPSPSPHPLSSTSHGVAGTSGTGGFIRVVMALGVSLVMMMLFFI